MNQRYQIARENSSRLTLRTARRGCASSTRRRSRMIAQGERQASSSPPGVRGESAPFLRARGSQNRALLRTGADARTWTQAVLRRFPSHRGAERLMAALCARMAALRTRSTLDQERAACLEGPKCGWRPRDLFRRPAPKKPESVVSLSAVRRLCLDAITTHAIGAENNQSAALFREPPAMQTQSSAGNPSVPTATSLLIVALVCALLAYIIWM